MYPSKNSVFQLSFYLAMNSGIKNPVAICNVTQKLFLWLSAENKLVFCLCKSLLIL